MNGSRGLWLMLLALLGVALVGGLPFSRLAPIDLGAFDSVAGAGFYAWFGFASGLVLILLGLLLGFVLKRRETYYDD